MKLIQYYQNGSNEAQNSFNKKMNVNISSEIMILIMLMDINVDLVKNLCLIFCDTLYMFEKKRKLFRFQ